MIRAGEMLADPEAAYEKYVEQGGANVMLLKTLHFVSGLLFHPEAVYAEGSQEAIGGHLKAGKMGFFSFSHASAGDVPILASVMEHDEAYDNVLGYTVTPAKAELTKKPGLGRVLTALGAIETHRTESVYGKQGKDSNGAKERAIGEDVEDRRLQAVEQMVRVCSYFIGHPDPSQRRHVAGFWDGRRNRGDRTVAQKVKAGPRLILNEIQNREDVMVIFMSPYFNNRKHLKNIFGASVGIGHLALRDVKGRVTQRMLQEGQQSALDLAVADYNRRHRVKA